MEMMMIAREIVVETRGVMDVVAAEETARLAVMEDKAKETVKVIISNPVVVVVDAVNRGEVSPTTIENKQAWQYTIFFKTFGYYLMSD